jgi:dihydrodipicolinate synthase/N-acetylneuraminate lyase
MPPYFFRYSQPEVERFYLDFAQDAPAQVPVLLYNIPFFSTPIEPETACRLLATGRFAGIKDSSGDWDYFTRLAEQRRTTPFTHMVGNDVVFTRERQAGADGVVSGVACAVPELMLGLDRACRPMRRRRKLGRLQSSSPGIDFFRRRSVREATGQECEDRPARDCASAVNEHPGRVAEWFPVAGGRQKEC